MSRKKKSSFSIGTIIFWGFLAYMWFGGDDSDKKEVEIIEQNVPAIEQTVEAKPKAKSFKDLEIIIKDAASEIKDVAINTIEDLTEQKKVESKPDPVPDPEPPTEKSEEMIAKPEVKIEPELKSVNDKPKDMGMKKL